MFVENEEAGVKMNQSLDDKIRTRLLEKDIKMPEECRKRIEETMKGLSEKEIKRKHLQFQSAAVIAVAFLLISSVTVYASIDYITQRMENLSKVEKDSYYEGVQDSAADADSYTRELTDQEKDRMEELKAEYKKGTFPVKALTIVSTQADADGKTEFYFIEDKSLFVLPPRELTDEEMLEIIDFYYCRDYSLTERVQQENTVPDGSDKFIESGGMDKEQAIELAKALIADIYGTDCPGYDITVNYDDMGGYGNLYRVVMADSKTESNFNITVDADLKSVTDVYYAQPGNYSVSGIEVDQAKFIAKYEDALYILTKKMGIELPIVQSTCEYNYNSDGCLERGVVSYLFKLEDGTGYVIKYSCADDLFFNIFMTDYEGYRKLMDQNDSKRKERGLNREIIQMQ